MKDADLFTLAPAGQIYVCGACGKQSRNRAGFLPENVSTFPNGDRVASPGWDESCFLHAVLCYERTAKDLSWRAVEK